MTPTPARSLAIGHAPQRRSLPRRSDALCRWFGWWVRGYLARHFHSVRLTLGSRPEVPPELPLIVVLNHPSWWDPLIGMILAGHFPERTHYAAMDAKALERYSLFRRLGFFGVEQGTARGAFAFLNTTAAILSRPNTSVWITAQGRLTDVRVRPPRLRPGIGHVVRRLNQGVVLTLALEYAFWEERLPEALARFGDAIRIDCGRDLGAAEWVERIESSLAATQDALMADAMNRAADAFQMVLVGKAAIGGTCDRWQKAWALVRGERFHPETAPKGGRPWG
jgi:1-acyl-sn-glycerol-3-phosphate acyltransferase